MSVAELEENDIIEDEFVDVEEVDEEVDNDQTEVDEIVSEDESSDESDDTDSEVEEDEDEVEISFDGESLSPEDDEEKDAKPWLREERKKHKEAKKKIRELERKLEESAKKANPPAPQAGDPGKKPTLGDFDYESEPYEVALDKWYLADREFQEVKRNQENEQRKANEEWQSKLSNFEKQKKKLGLKDFDDAEEYVANTLTDTQRGIIVDGSDNPALSFYAIGKNKALAKELASITNPVKFAFAVSKMENKLKMGKKKARTSPESTLKSSGGSSGKDNTLERLRAEADKTNDRTKVVAYMRKLKANNN